MKRNSQPGQCIHRLIGLAAIAWIAVTCGALSGCAQPGPAGPAPWNPLNAAEASLTADKGNINYVLTRMEFARAAMLLGCPGRAHPRLKEAFDQLEVQQDNTAAALSSESFKYYKGECYERAMVCMYLGYTEYMRGNYNDARIYFSRALLADKGSRMQESTPESFGDDFGAAYYWLGKVYRQLGESDNSQIAFRKAAVEVARKQQDRERELREDRDSAKRFEKRRAEGEEWAYQTFHNPREPKLFCDGAVDLTHGAPPPAGASAGQGQSGLAIQPAAGPGEFFTPEFQQQANLVLTVELGACPLKVLGGLAQERTEIVRACILPNEVEVYIDDQPAGKAFRVLDLWDQAATQDRVAEKDAAQTTKAILKKVGEQVPYVGSLVSYWDISGDMRRWTSLPGRVYVYAAKVPLGVHTVRLEMRGVDGAVLPRWRNTYHGVTTREGRETCAFVTPRYDGDNVLAPEKRQAAASAGAVGIGEEMVIVRGAGH